MGKERLKEYAAIRGASKSCGKREWGSHIAMSWYGGVPWDKMYFKRWKTALYYAYIAGATFIYSEGGHFGINYLGLNHKFDSPECKRFRKVLREFYHFCQLHPRPSKGPEVKIAFIQGRFDGNAGHGSRYTWGQFAEGWEHQEPEHSLDYLDNLFHRERWFSNTLSGDMDFSGNPPFGQYDILPIEAPLKVLREYTLLVFLGWNTIAEEDYDKLKSYVRGGGHLVMSLSHLNTNPSRNLEKMKLYNNGDFSDLFGLIIKGREKVLKGAGIKFVNNSSLKSYRFPNWTSHCDPKFINGDLHLAKIELKGAGALASSSQYFHPLKGERIIPVLTEYKLGRGKAFLITSYDHPGARSLSLFMKELLRDAVIGEIDNYLNVICSDKVSWSIYEENSLAAIYLLNTDFDLPQTAKVCFGDLIFPVHIKEAGIRIVHGYKNKLLISPEESDVQIQGIKEKDNEYLISLKGEGEKRIDIHTGRKPVSLKIKLKGEKLLKIK